MNSAHSAQVHPIWGFIPLLAAALLATAILLGVPSLFGLLLEVPAFAELDTAVMASLFTLTTFGLLALVAFLAMRFSAIGLALGKHKAVMAGAGTGLGILALTAALALSAIAGCVQEGMPTEQGAGLFLLETVLLLIQSGSEELYFRGWLQADLQRRWGAWAALLTTAFVFAILHFVAAAEEPASFVTLLLGGVLFGLLYQKSGSFLLAWGVHFGWNWAEEMVFGLTPNPEAGPFGTFINLDLIGSTWWGGSAEGLNASLSSMLVLIAVIAATFAWPTAGENAAPRPAARSRAVR